MRAVDDSGNESPDSNEAPGMTESAERFDWLWIFVAVLIVVVVVVVAVFVLLKRRSDVREEIEEEVREE